MGASIEAFSFGDLVQKVHQENLHGTFTLAKDATFAMFICLFVCQPLLNLH